VYCLRPSEICVCIPRLFVRRSEDLLGVSLAVTIVNFLLFVFIAFAYVLIVVNSKQNKRLQEANAVSHHASGTSGENRSNGKSVMIYL